MLRQRVASAAFREATAAASLPASLPAPGQVARGASTLTSLAPATEGAAARDVGVGLVLDDSAVDGLAATLAIRGGAKGDAAAARSHAYLPPHASCWHRRVHAASDRAEADATVKQTPEPLAAAARRVGAERGREAANGVLLAHEAYAMPRVHTALARRNPLASTP